jgi:hypothetical protein
MMVVEDALVGAGKEIARMVPGAPFDSDGMMAVEVARAAHRVERVLYHSGPSVDYSWNMKNIQLICQIIPQSIVYSEYPNPEPQHCRSISYSEIHITIPIEKQCCVIKTTCISNKSSAQPRICLEH